MHLLTFTGSLWLQWYPLGHDHFRIEDNPFGVVDQQKGPSETLLSLCQVLLHEITLSPHISSMFQEAPVTKGHSWWCNHNLSSLLMLLMLMWLLTVAPCLLLLTPLLASVGNQYDDFFVNTHILHGREHQTFSIQLLLSCSLLIQLTASGDWKTSPYLILHKHSLLIKLCCRS